MAKKITKKINKKRSKVNEKYKMITSCRNCNQDNDTQIPKGQLIKDALQKIKCKNCGCLTLEPKTTRLITIFDRPLTKPTSPIIKTPVPLPINEPYRPFPLKPQKPILTFRNRIL